MIPILLYHPKEYYQNDHTTHHRVEPLQKSGSVEVSRQLDTMPDG